MAYVPPFLTWNKLELVAVKVSLWYFDSPRVKVEQGLETKSLHTFLMYGCGEGLDQFSLLKL